MTFYNKYGILMAEMHHSLYFKYKKEEPVHSWDIQRHGVMNTLQTVLKMERCIVQVVITVERVTTRQTIVLAKENYMLHQDCI